MCAKVSETIKESIEKPDFVNNHKRSENDFTRNRILTFQKVFLSSLLTFDSSINNLISKINLFDDEIPLSLTASAVCQARQKIKFTAFQEMFEKVREIFYKEPAFVKIWKGFRLVAVDGTQINCQEYGESVNYFGKTNISNGESVRGRISVLYDVLNDVVINGKIMPFEADENAILFYMRESLKKGDLLLADRYYPSFHTFKYLENRKIDFLMRVPSKKWNVAKEFIDSGKKEEVINLESLYPKVLERCLSDGLDCKPMKIRLIRVELGDEKKTIEVLATSLLDKARYPHSDFGNLYIKRWGVETFYNTLKERMKLEKFSGINLNSIFSDFYGKLLFNNITRILSLSVRDYAETKLKKRKDKYKVNNKSAVDFLRNHFFNFLRNITKTIENIHSFLISRFEMTERNRSFERHVSTIAKLKKSMSYK